MQVLELRATSEGYSLSVWHTVLLKIQSALRAADAFAGANVEAPALPPPPAAQPSFPAAAVTAAPSAVPPPPAAPPSFPASARGAAAPSAVPPRAAPPARPVAASAASPLSARSSRGQQAALLMQQKALARRRTNGNGCVALLPRASLRSPARASLAHALTHLFFCLLILFFCLFFCSTAPLRAALRRA